MSAYEVAPAARLDLLELWHRIAEDDLDRADRIVNEIEQTFALIVSHPRMGQPRLTRTIRSIGSKPAVQRMRNSLGPSQVQRLILGDTSTSQLMRAIRSTSQLTRAIRLKRYGEPEEKIADDQEEPES